MDINEIYITKYLLDKLLCIIDWMWWHAVTVNIIFLTVYQEYVSFPFHWDYLHQDNQ